MSKDVIPLEPIRLSSSWSKYSQLYFSNYSALQGAYNIFLIETTSHRYKSVLAVVATPEDGLHRGEQNGNNSTVRCAASKHIPQIHRTQLALSCDLGIRDITSRANRHLVSYRGGSRGGGGYWASGPPTFGGP